MYDIYINYILKAPLGMKRKHIVAISILPK